MCKHGHLEAHVAVTPAGPNQWQATLSMKCSDCGIPFEFEGRPAVTLAAAPKQTTTPPPWAGGGA